MKQILLIINNEYKNYRKAVPRYASAALSFYLVMMVVPALTLIAIAINSMHLDLTSLKNILDDFLFPQYTTVFLDILESRSYSSVALMTTVISFWVVLRGVTVIHEISNNLFNNETETMIPFVFHSLEITLLILLFAIIEIVIYVIGPLSTVIHELATIKSIKYLFLFFGLIIIFTILYDIIPRQASNLIDAITGGLFTGTCFFIVHFFLSFYFSYAHYESVYGPLSILIMILFMIRIYAEIFYIGLFITCRMKNWRETHGKIRN